MYFWLSRMQGNQEEDLLHAYHKLGQPPMMFILIAVAFSCPDILSSNALHTLTVHELYSSLFTPEVLLFLVCQKHTCSHSFLNSCSKLLKVVFGNEDFVETHYCMIYYSFRGALKQLTALDQVLSSSSQFVQILLPCMALLFLAG